MNSLKPLYKRIQGSGPRVEALFTSGRRLRRLDARVRALMDPALAPHCRVANLRDQVLVLQADSPAWASRLRFLAPALPGILAPHGIGVKRVEVRIAPPAADPAPPRRPRRRLSQAAAAHLERAAEGIRDPALAAALRRLARRS